MRNLSSLLSRIANSLNRDELTKGTVISVVENLTKVKLKEENISLKNGVLEIITTPTAKSEIRMKEDSIKNTLREQSVYVTRVLYK